jgi:hypothetical protein
MDIAAKGEQASCVGKVTTLQIETIVKSPNFDTTDAEFLMAAAAIRQL